MKPAERVPYKPGVTPMQPSEMPKQKSIEKIGAEVQANISVKKIKKELRRLPPLSPEIIAERDRRLGERED